MRWLDRIRAVNTYDLKNFRPFIVAGVQVGYLRPTFAELLTRWPQTFRVERSEVSIVPNLTTPTARSAAVREVAATLQVEGMIAGWRDELYAVKRSYAEAPYLWMERAVTPYFGVRTYGVHVNGLVRTADGLKMWLGRRSQRVRNEPGKLDQLAAGGQPAGLSLKANVIKECAEEAGVPVELATQATPVGAISYCRETAKGLRPDVIFVFDLELPADFIPSNTDGEVDDFYLLPIEQVIDIVCNSAEFKQNCTLVIIDFLIRYGYISPEHPDYLEILRSLRML